MQKRQDLRLLSFLTIGELSRKFCSKLSENFGWFQSVTNAGFMLALDTDIEGPLALSIITVLLK
jgi:hypothetical protein